MNKSSFNGIVKTIKLLFCSLTIILALALSGAAAPLDFDGDGKTDYTAARASGSNLIWYILKSSNNTLRQEYFGIATPSPDVLVPEDYDGDGKWDPAVYRKTTSMGIDLGYFFFLRSTDGTTQSVQWGGGNALATRSQDFDGDGKADPTVIQRNSDNSLTWHTLFTTGSRSVDFGTWGDKGIRGDFDGDGIADIAVYRSNYAGADPQFTFFVNRSSDNTLQSQQLGSSGDTIVEADFDGDSKTDYVVYHSGSYYGTWYWIESSDASSHELQYGLSNYHDHPAPGDYDGDGVTDHAVRRRLSESFSATSIFYVNGSAAGAMSQEWGLTGDYEIFSILLSYT